MRDLATGAAGAAGLLVALGLVAAAAPRVPPVPAPRVLERWRRAEAARAAAAWPGADWRALLLAQAALGGAGALAAWTVTGIASLAAAAGVAAAAGIRIVLSIRASRWRRARQDAALEAVRMLRGLLESGAVGVQQGLAVLAERGPVALRPEFAAIVAAGAAGRQPAAWAAARERVGDPLFDMLCAAVLVQRPAGGALAPLFADLEESVAGIHEVTREAEALQVQARSAAGLVVMLPLAFLLVLSLLRSPYLDAYRTPAGSAFLAAMLAVIGLSYVWVLRWLRLPGEPRLEVDDG